MPIKFDLTKYKTEVFIETGTYHGKGCINAIDAGFNEIHTVEILQENQEIAKRNLKKYGDIIIKYYLGDSAKIMPKILSNITNRSTIWLDGHGGYSGAGSGIKNCPLIEELEAISKHHIKNHIIMIDDLRIINKDAWQTGGINEEKLKSILLKINPEYEFYYEDGEVENDCLIAL